MFRQKNAKLNFIFVKIYKNNISPSTFEQHGRNETLHNHDYTEDGLFNIFYILFFSLFLFFVYTGIIMSCMYWKKDLEEKEKDNGIGNAEL